MLVSTLFYSICIPVSEDALFSFFMTQMCMGGAWNIKYGPRVYYKNVYIWVNVRYTRTSYTQHFLLYVIFFNQRQLHLYIFI